MAGRVTLLDGSFATQLSKYVKEPIDGHPLWASRFLFTDEDKENCIAAHRDFIRAGSKVLHTNSYQSTVPGLREHMNLSQEDAVEVIKDSVRILKEAILQEEKLIGKKLNIKIAGTVGPYGAYLHDGSEYSGAYCNSITKAELMEWHRPRIQALIEAGADLLAFLTVPCFKEAVALIELLKEFPKANAWLSFSIKNESQISNGEVFAEVANNCWALGSPQLIAIGANCFNPAYVFPLFTALIKKNPAIPLMAMPNSGEVYDVKEKKWIEKENCKKFTSYEEEWLNLGISYLGGCCRTTNIEIEELSQKIQKWQNKK